MPSYDSGIMEALRPSSSPERNRGARAAGRPLRRFFRGQEAVPTLEYAMVVGFVAVALAAVLRAFAGLIAGAREPDRPPRPRHRPGRRRLNPGAP